MSALLLLVAVAAVAATPAAGRSVQLTKVKVAILPLEPTAQAMYAKHRAMFRKQGLDVELKILTDPTQTVATLLAGDADFVATHVGAAASLKSRGAPIRVVAAGATYDPKKANSSLIAAPGRTITRARDLVGKTIAIDGPNTIADIGVLKWLKVNGVDRGDVKIVYLPFPLMIGPLIQGTLDAAFVPEPYPYAGARAGGEAHRESLPGGVHEGLRADVLDRAGRRRPEPRRALPERHPVGRRLGESE